MYQERHIQYKTSQLFQLTRLRGSDSLVVFFHGIGDSHLSFMRFFDESFLPHADIFISDLLGHGRSGSFENYSFSQQVDALLFQLSPLLLQYKQVIFVPHSMGGIHATLLAANAFKGMVNGIFAVETSVTQFGSFIAEKVFNLVKDAQDFSAWFRGFCQEIHKKKNDPILKNYYCGLQHVREEAFLANAVEMFSLATALKERPYTHKIGEMFASLSMPKVYCLGSFGKQLLSVPFLEKNHIALAYFPTDSHWVAQACFSDFCHRLEHFMASID